jgi:copper(I)-binding protein
MLLGLKHTLAKGAQVPISLTFADRDKKRFTVKTTALVRDLGASADMPMEHNMK